MRFECVDLSLLIEVVALEAVELCRNLVDLVPLTLLLVLDALGVPVSNVLAAVAKLGSEGLLTIVRICR